MHFAAVSDANNGHHDIPVLAHVAHDEESITVLLGDFNAWLLVGRPLRWLHGRFGRSASHATYPSAFPILSLDRVWVHPRHMLAHVRCHREGEARVASDHLPLVATLKPLALG